MGPCWSEVVLQGSDEKDWWSDEGDYESEVGSEL